MCPMTAETADVDYRIERDTMGEVRVPAAALYQAQTQRAVENFPISGTRLERSHIEALARIKKAAAQANAKLGVLDADVAAAIVAAADEVAGGAHDDHFPIDIFQTGSGTSSNMNTNEVLATLATRHLGRDVHPNDHVNASQSSNDVFPTSVHLAATSGVDFHAPFGGEKDVADRVVRAVGKPAQRFAEDYLRILRALRFAARFSFSIAPETWAAARAAGE